MQDRRQTAGARFLSHALLVAPVLAFFAPALFFGRVLYLRDTGLYFYPHKALIARALHEGRLPQWNPFEFGGVPLLADPNFNVFHPLSLLTWLLPLPLGFTLFVACCALLGAYGARALARCLGVSWSGALVCGIAFGWSGAFVSLLESGQCVAPAFLPWLCAAGAALGASASSSAQEVRRTAALAALCVALIFLSGTPEIGACALGLGALLAVAGAAPGFRARALTWFGFAAVLGAGIAAVQLLPAAAFLGRSSRAGGFDLRQATAYSLHPLRLPGLLFPFFAGELDAPGTPQWLLDPGKAPYVQEIYSGALILLLACLALSRDRQARLRLLFAAACAGLLVLSLGSYTPAYRLVSAVLPPLRFVRYPEKLVLPAGLAFALLAGAGWDRLQAWSSRSSPGAAGSRAVFERRAAVAAALLGLAALGAFGAALHPPGPVLALGAARAACLRATALPAVGSELAALALALGCCVLRSRGLLGARAFALAIASLIAVDLGAPAARLDHTVPAGELTAPAPLAAVLRGQAHAPLEDFRVSVQATGIDAKALDALFDPAWSRPRKLFRLRHLSLYDAGAALAGVYVDRGYSGFTPGPLHDLYVANGKGALDLLGVRFGIELGSPVSLYGPLGFRPRLGALSNQIRVLENPDAMARLRLVAAVLAPAATPLALPPCPGRDAVWLEPRDAQALALRTGSRPPGPAGAQVPRLAVAPDCARLPAPVSGGTARIVRYRPEEVEGEVDAALPSLAVLADTWEPGWTVSVDGAEAISLAADGVLRAVSVPAGHHRVLWTYRAPGLLAGAWLSLISVVAWIALFRRTGCRTPVVPPSHALGAR